MNKLTSNWNLRAKYVDDLTIVEIIQRYSCSMLPIIANEIGTFSEEHGMRLNDPKCKDILIEFLRYKPFPTTPIFINGLPIEQVSTHKVIWVHIASDLSWGYHCEYIVKRARKRHSICVKGPGARFSKVPKLNGPFSGVTIPFVSQEWRGFNSSDFTVIFLFVTFKTCYKIGFPKQAVASLANGFSGPKSYRDFRETGPWLNQVYQVKRYILQVYCSLVRPVLEYASPVWAGLPDYLSDLIESVQRESLHIIPPILSYDQTLVRSGLQTLERRGQACERFVQSLSVLSSPCIAGLLPERSSVSHGYGLRSGTARQCVNNNRLLRTYKFITFKYG